jgi:hypothetical protein
VAPGPRDDQLVAGDDREHGTRGRRGVGWAAALVAAGALLAVVRPDLALHGEAPPPSRAPATVRPEPQGNVAWDPRGDLAGDEGFVFDAVRRVRADRPDVARVYFAGRLPDGGRLVLTGADSYFGTGTLVQALVVPPGADPADGSVVDAGVVSAPDDLLAWAGRGADGGVVAVLLARPGPVRFQASPLVDHDDRTGEPSRRWRTFRSADGVSVARLGPAADPAIAVRAYAPGVTATTRLVPLLWPHPAPTVIDVDGVGAAAYAGPRTPLLVDALRSSLSELVDFPASRLRVLWSGVPWKQRPLALVLVTRPDGVRLQALVGEQDGHPFGAGVRALPVRDPDDAPWLLEPFTAQDPTFVLVPSGPGTLVYRRPGRTVRLAVGPDGAVPIVEPGPAPPTARGAQVTVLDPAGRTLLTTTLPRGPLDDPLALAASDR